MNRRRLLVISPLCNGEDIGESWCAFQLVSRLSQRHDVTVLTYTKRGGVSLGKQLPEARVVEWAEPALLGRAERFNSMLKPGYVPFYLRARHWVRAALRGGDRFDLAHQIGPLALRYPTPLASLPLPYVVGPVGGSLDDPRGFGPDETAAWYVGLRDLDRWRLRRDPLLRRSYQRAAAVLGAAPYVEHVLGDLAGQRFHVESDTGIDTLPSAVDRGGRVGSVQLLYVGRLVRAKGVRELLRAMAQLRDLPVVLTIAGDGFDRPACERLVDELGLTEHVTLLGAVPHGDVASLYRSADVFVFPSYREPGGIVVTEAMSHGLPVVVCDRGGPAHTVDDASGIRVPLRGSPESYVDDLAAAVRQLVAEPGRRRALGDAARQRVESLALWDRKVDRIEAIYARILS